MRASRWIPLEDVYESSWISAPMTAGWLNPRILLPAGWREWEPAKLEAVLAHERTHIRRGDWAIAVMAGVNRRLFWFHPLAWWLERRLAELAEQACDDAALLETGARESYARALLDMAAAVRTAQGRMNWEAVAMAKPVQVKERIERVLDGNRELPRGLTARRWAVLAACSLPMVYFAAALQFVPAVAQDRPPVKVEWGIPGAEAMVDANQMNAAEAERLEQRLLQEPEDLGARARLLGYYYINAKKPERMKHVLWVIEHHPEWAQPGFSAVGISAMGNLFNDKTDYDRAAALWRQEAAIHPNDARVLANAAAALGQPGGDYPEAERLYERARQIDPANGAYTLGLVNMYVGALASDAMSRMAGAPNLHTDPAFAAMTRSKLESSNDGPLLAEIGDRLAFRFHLSGTSGEDTQLKEFGHRLLARAEQLGVKPPVHQQPAPPPVKRDPEPALVQKVDPTYPPLALQARISGVVHLEVTTNADGSVASTRVIMGHPMLAPAAIDAVRHWKYVAGVATFEVQVPFTLSPGTAVPKADTTGGVPKGMGTAMSVSRIRVGANIQDARVMHRVEPEYPPLARQARIESTVRLNVTIARDGHVINVQAIEGHPLLVPPAIEAVKQWIYNPTLLNGSPVEVATEVDLEFRLK
jgi:TonB family protein